MRSDSSRAAGGEKQGADAGLKVTMTTSKYQTTVPKEVRRKLGLCPRDVLREEVVDGGVQIIPAWRGFLDHRGCVRVGPGSVVEDVRRARAQRGTEAK